MPEVKRAKKGKKRRKLGRDKNRCAAYQASHRREHNKVRRLKKHLKRFPADQTAAKAVALCMIAIRGH